MRDWRRVARGVLVWVEVDGVWVVEVEKADSVA